MFQYKYLSVFILIFLSFTIGCNSSKKAMQTVELPLIDLDTMVISGKKPFYNASKKRVNDIIHTKLELSFNWEKQYAYGKANLKIKPYFYETDVLVLDAKGFELNEVAIKNGGSKKALNYKYDGAKINIELDRVYNRNETYDIFIDYIAKPNELANTKGSAAITQRKGLYFINPLNEEEDKPRQFWTQGETEASSCWFPTIDSPNERTSQEIYLTVEEAHKTISNGLLINSKSNGDGTRTDYWKQDIPHAPYLFMIASGPFSEIKDRWKNIETNYYVDEEYAPYAKEVFGNTGEMLDFFSTKFGMQYPWDKYHQVVVHDFVSGAMENTSAVIHYDGLHQTDRDLLDGTKEDIIAHEAAHHWFGDWVTCESWANIPLNEAFATWSEIIWEEHKYGRDAAEFKISTDRAWYFDEAESYQVPLIRYYYEKKEDMFDRHSYQKGGQVLWMLQEYLGDEAYYEGLKKYLNDNAQQTVEIHDLRIALEEVCGEDLNWFFNQWFMKPGHPVLTVESSYDAELGKAIVAVRQEQETQLFRLPIKIDIYTNNNIETKEVIIKERESVFTFNTTEHPQLIDFDAGNYLLAEITEDKSLNHWVYQFNNTKGFLNHLEAFVAITQNYDIEAETEEIIIAALDNPFWYIRELAISNLYINSDNSAIVKEKLFDIADNDEKSDVRRAAINKITNEGWDVEENKILNWLANKSYKVSAAGLAALIEKNPDLAIEKAEALKEETNNEILSGVASVFATSADTKYNDFYKNYYKKARSFGKYGAIRNYSKYLTEIDDEDMLIDAGGFLQSVALDSDRKWLRYRAAEAIYNKRNDLLSKKNDIIYRNNTGNGSPVDQVDMDKIDRIVSNFDQLLEVIKMEEKETDVSNYYKMFQ